MAIVTGGHSRIVANIFLVISVILIPPSRSKFTAEAATVISLAYATLNLVADPPDRPAPGRSQLVTSVDGSTETLSGAGCVSPGPSCVALACSADSARTSAKVRTGALSVPMITISLISLSVD